MDVNSVISNLKADRELAKGRTMVLRADNEMNEGREKAKHPNQRLPSFVDWRTRCPNIFWDFPNKATLLPVVPAIFQGNCLVADFLLVLTGVSGRYIAPDRNSKSDHKAFVFADGLETSYVQLAKSILPLATAFSNVSRFVEEKRKCSSGQVNHALAAGLERICRDYLSVMSRLSAEQRMGKLNLQTLYSRVQPYMYTFRVLSGVCDQIEPDVKGGRTLTILSNTARKTSDKTELLIQHLLETAALPYMQQLHIWLTQGVVDDPYCEFLIEDNQVVVQKEQLPDEYSEDYWVKCYTVCKERVPDFLGPYAQTILRTGKYLNVLRQCGIHSVGTDLPELRFSCTENLYAEHIRDAHNEASTCLLKHLMGDVDLIGHLKSVRNYLLLAQGDLLSKFMDMAAPELNKEIMEIVPSRLQSLLELALRTSAANSDPYKDLLRVELHQETVMSLLVRISGGCESIEGSASSGWEAVSFQYVPPWPVSLVLNRSALTIYQLMFRHLVYCRRVETLLHRVWLEHKRQELWAAWDLRQRMLLYVHNLEYYMLVEVIEPQWDLLLKKLPTCRDLDQVLECHNNFQSECLIKCMLNNPKHFEVLNTFLRQCVEFCRFMDACGLVEASPIHTAQPATAFTPGQSFASQITDFNKSFNQHVQYLFKTLRGSDAVRRSDKLMDMLYRMDFNSFYKSSVAERSRESTKSKNSIRSRDSATDSTVSSTGW